MLCGNLAAYITLDMADTPERKETWRMLEHRWGDLGFDGLEREEQEAIALFWLEAEVMNGGMHQYFFNSSGDGALLAVAGLQRLDASESLAVLEACMAKFGLEYPTDRETRGDLLDELGWDPDPFDAETRRLQDLPEDFFNLALDNVRALYQQRRSSNGEGHV